MPINTLTINDVFRWYYKDTTGRFEPYHCKSRIMIFNGDIFFDTFWGNVPHRNTWFTQDEADNLLELQYLGNLDEFESCREHDQAMYDDKDFMNLNHSNSSRDNYYLRKGATKSLDKMKKVLKRNILDVESVYQSAKWDYERELRALEELTVDSYVSARNGIPMCDDFYNDDQEIKGL